MLVHNTCAKTKNSKGNRLVAPKETKLLVDDVNKKSSKVYMSGKDGESELANLVGGESQAYFPTSLGGRFVDQLTDNGIAHESKVGYTSLTKRIRTQVLKDAELIRNGDINGAHWHFFKSGVTGKGGPSRPLRKFLEDNGINYTIH